MARFNSKKLPVYEAQRTTNLAGGSAFTQSWKEELVSLLLTSMVQEQYYRSAQGGVDRLAELVNDRIIEADRKFIGKAGIFARQEFGLRSISHILAALIGMNYKGHDWTKFFFSKVVRRPDDMAEIMTLIMKQQQKIPNALKKGFAHRLAQFDAYQLAKYRMETKAIKLVDIVNMVHPKPTDALTALVQGTLKPAETWETQVSAAGQKSEPAAAKQEAWDALLKSKKLGYMALLKNVRNIVMSGVLNSKEASDELVKQLTNVQAIKKSLVLPFRFVTAYDEVSKFFMGSHGNTIIEAIDKAATMALDNVPVFDGSTLVVLDQSGSMDTGVGTSTAIKIGALFTSMLWKKNEDCDVIVFGSSAHYVEPRYRMNSLLNLTGQLAHASMGGTAFSAPFRCARRPYDRIIILSDMQGWMDDRSAFEGGFRDYLKKHPCQPHLYSFDLCGYGSLQFPRDKVYIMAGFSEKIFDVMKMLETDRNALIAKIDAVKL